MTTDFSKRLRQEQTDAEARLWSRIRNQQLGVKFRRQHRLGGYIADFYCAESLLIVELDGGQHQIEAARDAQRAVDLEAFGLRVLRFWNHDALARTDEVVQAIWAALQEPVPPHPNPLPRRRRGRGGRVSAQTDDSLSRVPEIAHTVTQLNLATSRFSPSPPSPTGERVGVRGALPSRRTSLILRANAYRRIREFFAERGVLEVETPIFSAGANTEPNIESFSVRFSGPLPDGGPRERWLRTSPEFALKRLLAEGVGDCYELGRVFRDGEAGRRHNPEFTMLEWYRLGWTHRELAEETADLVRALMADAGLALEVHRIEYRALYREAFGFDPFTADVETLRAPLSGLDIRSHELSRDDWLDLLMTHRLQSGFPKDRLTVVFDFPPSQCALARVTGQGADAVAERFELYLGDKELANGYHELTDAGEQRGRFENDNRRRRARGQRELPIDAQLISALEHGLPDCAGVALGVERLLMALAGTDDIAEVLAFAFDRA